MSAAPPDGDDRSAPSPPSTRPDRQMAPTPGWVRAFGIAAVVVVVIVIAVLLLGGGNHGPSRHTSADAQGSTHEFAPLTRS